jgi:hypothetical protein
MDLTLQSESLMELDTSPFRKYSESNVAILSKIKKDNSYEKLE